MSTSPPEPAWHPDPTGAHQLRYWDGAQWTAWVSDDGVQSEDPLPGAAPGATDADGGTGAAPAGTTGDLESIAGLTHLRLEMVGGKSPAGWRAIRDDAGTDLARVWCERGVSRLCDLSGATVLTVTAAMRHRSDKEITGLSVTGADGALATVSYTQARSTTLKCSHDGNRILTVKFRQKLTGKLEDGVLLDGDERQIGTLEEVDRGGTGLVRSWLVLDRDPGLTDPVRTLAVAAPVIVDTYLNGVWRA